jgi:hypothetical protein
MIGHHLTTGHALRIASLGDFVVNASIVEYIPHGRPTTPLGYRVHEICLSSKHHYIVGDSIYIFNAFLVSYCKNYPLHSPAEA